MYFTLNLLITSLIRLSDFKMLFPTQQNFEDWWYGIVTKIRLNSLWLRPEDSLEDVLMSLSKGNWWYLFWFLALWVEMLELNLKIYSLNPYSDFLMDKEQITLFLNFLSGIKDSFITT